MLLNKSACLVRYETEDTGKFNRVSYYIALNFDHVYNFPIDLQPNEPFCFKSIGEVVNRIKFS